MVPYPTALERFPRIRQSDLATFDNCALQWYFDDAWRQGWSSHPAAAGTLLHRVFQKCVVDMIANGENQVPVDHALVELNEQLRQHDVPLHAPDSYSEVVLNVPSKWRYEARIIVKAWAQNMVWDTHLIALVEKRLSMTVAYPDGEGGVVERELTGKPDVVLVDDITATVVDYKTGWGIPSEGRKRSREDLAGDGDNISEEGFFWMRFYAALVFLRWPRIQRVILRELYPRFLSGRATDSGGRPINPVRQASIDRYELDDIMAELAALVERFDRAIEAGEEEEVGQRAWTPSPGTHCSYCPGILQCPIPDDARGEGRIRDRAHAEEVAGYLNVSRGISDQMADALRGWTRAHGPVDVKDAKRPRVYGPVVRTRKVSPSRNRIAEAITRGENVDDLYEEEEYTVFALHQPEEEHPTVRAAREEEELMLAMEKAAEEREEQ